MSGSKRLLFEMEERRGRANAILLGCGAIKECENHGYLIDEVDDAAVEDAVEVAREQEGLDEPAAREFLKHALEQLGDECPGCSSNLHN